MSLRCSCSDQGDEIVFGQCRKCKPEPEEPREWRWETTLGPDDLDPGDA